jgi:membrane protease YdiL (CAAX protease family)
MVIFGWMGAYLVANILSGVIASIANTQSGEEPMWVLGLSALALWTPFVVLLALLSTRFGSASFSVDYAVRFRPSDVLGIPIGVASQLVLVNLVYWPLRAIFPDTFSSSEIEERARDLYDRASGGWLIVLVLVVVVGAPLVEELVYRGFIHGTLRSRLSDGVALLLAAVWFTAVHLTPVEYPGLFAFAVVLGLCFHFTGRLGLPIVAHMAFNATGLLLVALS